MASCATRSHTGKPSESLKDSMLPPGYLFQELKINWLISTDHMLIKLSWHHYSNMKIYQKNQQLIDHLDDLIQIMLYRPGSSQFVSLS